MCMSSEDELFYTLEGEITLDRVDRSKTAGPGAFIRLPHGVPHGYRNTSARSARMLIVTTPGGGLEGVFRGLDAAACGQAGLAPRGYRANLRRALRHHELMFERPAASISTVGAAASVHQGMPRTE